MPSGKPKPGNVRIQLCITEEADKLLREKSPKQGDKSKIVNDLILQAYKKQ